MTPSCSRVVLSFVVVACLALAAPTASAKGLSDDAVKQAIIQQSLQAYPGHCPCPYNTDSAGHSCGRRSAYSKPGGYAPLCYPADVTPEMIRRYREQHPTGD
jgi:uncharacterized membrane protein